MESKVRVKRFLTAICLAAGLLVAPVRPAEEGLGIGAAPALAKDCKLTIEVCEEINLVFWKHSACWTIGFFCD
jgi:hypothetical protein